MIRQTLLFGTNNPHKLREIKEIIGEAYKVLQLSDLGKQIEVEETEVTLEGNAMLKAKAFYRVSEIPCFADDTGLEVNALGGEPGVHTARYAGEQCSPKDNIDKLLRALKDQKDREARFRTVIAFFDGENEWVFEGVVEGEIAGIPCGNGGFGYDPVFIPRGYTQSFAELSPEEKHRISHRGKAVRRFADFITQYISS